MSSNKKKNRRIRKKKGFRIDELLEEQPFYNAPIEKPRSGNLRI